MGNRLMRATHHTPKVPGKSPPPSGSGVLRRVSSEELRAALDIILAAAANLRHYRDRLTPDDHAATVRDIEEAAERISADLTMEPAPPRDAMTDGKRRGR